MDFKSAIEQLKTNGRIDNYECDSRLEEHFIAIANKDGIEHLGAPQDKVEELLQLIAMSESLGGGAAGGVEMFNIAEVDRTAGSGGAQQILDAFNAGKKLIYLVENSSSNELGEGSFIGSVGFIFFNEEKVVVECYYGGSSFQPVSDKLTYYF